MPYGLANSKQLAMMDKVLASYCAAHHPDNSEKDDAARLILQLFDQGVRDEEALLNELRKRRPTHVTANGR